MSRVYFTHPEVLATLRSEYEQEVERDSVTLDKLHLDREQIHEEEMQRARRHLKSVEKGAVIDAFQRGLLSQTVQDKLLADVDAQLLRLESGEADESGGPKPVTERADGHTSVEKSDMQENK
jgi:hypothetical protein